jgi:hypothetical protein
MPRLRPEFRRNMGLYDFIIGGLAALAIISAIYYSVKLDQARRAGKIRYFGKTRIK